MVWVPAILGASAVKFKLIEHGLNQTQAVPFIAGWAAALLTGILAIYLLLKTVKAGKLWAFGVYCIAVGAITVILSR